jgi:integrase
VRYGHALQGDQALGYAEKRGTGDRAYWRGRYKTDPGKYGTVSHPDGSVVKFRTRKEAERAAGAEETARGQAVRQAAAEEEAGRMTFAAWASTWHAGLPDLDPDTLDGYRSIIEYHLLVPFGDRWLDEISRADIDRWEAAERARGYKPQGIANRRNLLSMILADAAGDPAVTLAANPAARRRRRGRRAGPEPGDDGDDDDEDDEQHAKVITTPLGALLIAERCAIMSGRDDECVLVTLGYYTGLRWGELAGLEVPFVRPGKIRVRWQLRRDRVRKRPKFGKVREADVPPFLGRLIAGHLERTRPQPCSCHGRAYVFSGLGRARGARQGVTVAEVARQAGVAQATVSAALNRPATVAPATRARIGQAIEATGWSRDQGTRPAHLYRSGFGQWAWGPAVSGWYPERAPMPRRVVPVMAAPWPGVPARGRGNTARADACWTPLAEGMTPHGLRHAHKSLMAELRTPEVLSHDRLGHEMPGIAGIYSHPTPPMRAELMAGLTACWEKALDERLAMCPDSPVPVLAALLRERAAGFSPRILPDDLGTGYLRAVPDL